MKTAIAEINSWKIICPECNVNIVLQKDPMSRKIKCSSCNEVFVCSSIFYR